MPWQADFLDADFAGCAEFFRHGLTLIDTDFLSHEKVQKTQKN
jgi:hypothetical protein